MYRKTTKILFILLMVACPLLAVAGSYDSSKLSPSLAHDLRIMASSAGSKGMVPKVAGKPSDMILAYIVLKNDNMPDLEARYGIEGMTRSGKVWVARIPLRQVLPLTEETNVERIECEPVSRAQLDQVVVEIGSQQANDGYQLPQAFTGKGVVAGIVDSGFDFTHPTFYDASGNLRMKRFWDQLASSDGSAPFGRIYDGADKIARLQHPYDAPYSYHGTHVLGIEAGSGDPVDHSFHGIATEADICGASVMLSNISVEGDPSKLMSETSYGLAFKYIFDYASEINEPCVINFSAGSDMDFRDSHRASIEFLDGLCGAGHIIVAAAANSGEHLSYAIAPPHTQGEAGLAGIAKYYTSQGDAHLYIRSRHQHNLRLRYNVSGQVFDIPLPKSLLYNAEGSDTKVIYTDEARSYELGTLEVENYLSPYSEDSIAELTLHTKTPDGAIAYCGFSSDEDNDEPIEFFWPANSSSTEIQGMFFNTACAFRAANLSWTALSDSIICVGATAHRANYMDIDHIQRAQYNADSEYPGHAVFSSEGPAFNGRIKPDVSAPGLHIVSAYNSFYSLPVNALLYGTLKGDAGYKWLVSSGTSMAAPVVTGTVALWLQANPKLTPGEIKNVFAHTSKQLYKDDYTVWPNSVLGYGEIDAYAGLLYILQLTGIHNLSRQQPARVSFAVSGGRLILSSVQPVQRGQAVLYNLKGQAVRTFAVNGRKTEEAVNDLPAGVYAVQLTASSSNHTGSTLIRITH